MSNERDYIGVQRLTSLLQENGIFTSTGDEFLVNLAQAISEGYNMANPWGAGGRLLRRMITRKVAGPLLTDIQEIFEAHVLPQRVPMLMERDRHDNWITMNSATPYTWEDLVMRDMKTTFNYHPRWDILTGSNPTMDITGITKPKPVATSWTGHYIWRYNWHLTNSDIMASWLSLLFDKKRVINSIETILYEILGIR